MTLITGATGFVGRELLDELRGTRRLRCLVRDTSGFDGGANVETVEADLADPTALADALDAVDSVYYLVHSMEAGAERRLRGARPAPGTEHGRRRPHEPRFSAGLSRWDRRLG